MLYFGLMRQLTHFINKLRHIFSPKIILFYPELPHKSSVIYKICFLLGYTISNDPSKPYVLAINWEDCTHRQDWDIAKALNLGCTDISKKRVDQAFNKVFGYGTTLNPLTHNGDCVVKSDINAKHDGKIIKCPIQEVQEGVIYQKVINNSFDNNKMVEDIRVPIFNNKMPFVYIKNRPMNNRFNNDNTGVKILSAEKAFWTYEITAILNFCKEIGLDYGELDILRDKDDKKIYIVDVNNTPWGPPNHLSRADNWKALSMMAKTFKETICFG